ncbi:MAG: hypothetical protein QM784_24105 [Polyangiaceae bacterium]
MQSRYTDFVGPVRIDVSDEFIGWAIYDCVVEKPTLTVPTGAA